MTNFWKILYCGKKFIPILSIHFLTICWRQLYRKWPTVFHKYAHTVATQKLEHVQSDYFFSLPPGVISHFSSKEPLQEFRINLPPSFHALRSCSHYCSQTLLHTSQYLGHQHLCMSLLEISSEQTTSTALFGRQMYIRHTVCLIDFHCDSFCFPL